MRGFRLSWLGVCGAIALLLLGCMGIQPTPTPPEPTPTVSPTVIKPPTLATPTQVPQVDQDQLVRHLQALNRERYTNRDRDRTRQYLVKTLSSYGWKPTIQPFETGANVTAQHPVTQSDRPTTQTLLLTAHFDSVQGSPGADDNASAVAAILEIARLLGDRTTHQTLAIAFFDREEAGLLGSLAYTANPANLSNLMGVINLEMLGYTCQTAGCQQYPEGLPITPPTNKGDFVGIVGDREHDYLLQAFEQVRQPTLPPLITIPIPFKGVLTPDVLRSDHAPFWANNIGAVMVSDTANFRNPNYHQPTDTPDTLNLDFLTQTTQLVLNATLSLLESQ